MAQGSAKLAKKKKSGGAQKRSVVRAKTVSKGRKDRKVKRKNNHSSAVRAEIAATTKAINRKNEKAIAAKAVAVGTQFFLSDISTKGKAEMEKQIKERNKKQDKASGAADRLKKELRKLGRDV